MTKEEIINQLTTKGYNNDASTTQQDLYTTIKRGQLFSGSNRLNSGWARGKHICHRIRQCIWTLMDRFQPSRAGSPAVLKRELTVSSVMWLQSRLKTAKRGLSPTPTC